MMWQLLHFWASVNHLIFGSSMIILQTFLQVQPQSSEAGPAEEGLADQDAGEVPPVQSASPASTGKPDALVPHVSRHSKSHLAPFSRR